MDLFRCLRRKSGDFFHKYLLRDGLVVNLLMRYISSKFISINKIISYFN